jgi:predicted outer membrane protein
VGFKSRAVYSVNVWDEEVIAREIETHREAIALYEDKANGSDAQLRVFARHILPHLQQHLAMLESLQSENRHARR